MLYSGVCFSQSKLPYANFVQTDTAVKWAAIYTSYINLTPVNPNFNIRNFYINKLKEQPGTAYREDNSGFTVSPVKVTYADYKAGLKAKTYDPLRMNWKFDYDDNGHNGFDNLFAEEVNACDTCANINKLSFLKVKQLLYYKDHRLNIKNILLSPLVYKKDTRTFKEGTVFYETAGFAFNESNTAENDIPPTAKLIGRAANELVLLPASQDNENNILTMDNWSLGIILYKDVKKNILKAYNTDNSIYPDTKKILDSRKIEMYKAEVIEVPVYDDDGNMKSYKKIAPEINYDSLYHYTLVQDFYFDFENEKLYSKLIAFIPRIRVITSMGIDLGLTNYWGVIFPETKKKAVKK